jgi:hypothetical protein
MKKIPRIDSAILQWIDKWKILNSRGQPFEWVKHNFLIKPMSDWSRIIAIRKSAQIGFSESFGIMKAIFGATNYGLDIIYTLPTDSAAELFVTTKLDAIIKQNPRLVTFISGGKSVKQVKDRFIYFRGTHSSKTQDKKAEGSKAISITSDLNIHDERDRSDKLTIDQYESRIENSDYGGIWSFSNPTYPGVGTDGLYEGDGTFEGSNQQVWMVQCESCNHFQFLDWVKLGEVRGVQDFALIDHHNQRFVCGKCRKEITDNMRFHGEWVAKYPERDTVSGYWMSQLNYVHHSVKRLLWKESRQTKQTFYNFVLGKPYRGTDISVSRQSIIDNVVPGTIDKTGVAMGVDNGIIKTYVLGTQDGIFKYGTTKSWAEIEKIIRQYKATTVIDAQPFPKKPKELVQKFRRRSEEGKVFVCYYRKDKDSLIPVEFGKGKDYGIVKVQRTMYFDILVDKFIDKEKPIAMIQRDLEEFIDHWLTLSRIDKSDAMGVIRGEWVSSTGKDHLAHATLYQDVALSKVTGFIPPKPRKVLVTDGKPAIEIDSEGLSALPDVRDLITESIKDLNNNNPDWRYD